MTTSTNTPRLTYLTSDGSTVNFTFNFSIADQNSIAVYVGTTLKTLTTDYTVSFDSGTSGTGTITLNSAPAINTRVYLIRDTYNVRSTDFAQGGAFLAATINNELDRITQGIQDVDNIVADKVIRVAEPTVETATLTLPAAATRASKTLGFDASGNVTVLTIGSGTVDSIGLSTSDANITLGGTNPVTGTGTITVNLTNPLVKNLTGDVTGNVTAASGTSTFNNLIINGDLTVEGTTTTVNTATLDVEDNIIRLATNQSGAPSVNAGIEVERGSSADKSLIWNETTDKWTIGSETFVAGTVEANVTGNLTGNVTGNADSATYASAVSLTADNTTNATNYLLFSNAVSGNQSPRTDTGLTYNPGTNTLTGGTFSGVFSGTLTGANDFITVVGDDSTGVNVTLGETIKIAGGSNITTSVSGDTLTINGSNPAQGITFVGDDSTGTRISDGETVKIAGTQNITTAVSGDTLTITGPNLSSYATTTYVDNKVSANNTLTIADDTSTTSSIDLDNTLQVIGGNNITTSISGSTLTITGDKSIDVNEINSGDSSAIQINDAVNVSGTLTANTVSTQSIGSTDNSNIIISPNGTGRITLDADIVNIGDGTGTSELRAYNNTILRLSAIETSSGNTSFIELPSGSNGNIKIQPHGTGDVHVYSDGLRLGDQNADATLATYGTGDLILTTHEGSGTEGVIRIYDGANGNITVTPNGTGDVQLVADTVQIGDSNADATITTNGTGDLILNTNSGTNSGSITVADGAAGTISIITNTTGNVDLNRAFNITNFPQTPDSANTNWAGAASSSYVGTRSLYSNQAQGDITDDAQRVRANSRVISIKHPNDSTTYNDTDYVIQNVDLTVVDINGQTFGSAHTGNRGASIRSSGQNVILKNTAGGTITGPNMMAAAALAQIDGGHGGDLTVSSMMGYRSLNTIRGDTTDITRITNAYNFLAESMTTGGTGANGTNRIVTNDFGYWARGPLGTSLTTNYYGFYVETGTNATNRYGIYVNNSAYSNLLGGLTIASNTISSSSNAAITLAPNGTGTVRLDTDFVRIGDNNVAATLSTNGTGDLTLSTNSGTNSGTIVITNGVNGNIILQPNGTGDVILSADTVQVGDLNATATLSTNGTGDLVLNTNAGSNSGSITITQGINANITLQPNGTGDVILSADTVQVGDSAAAATITSNGAGNLILQTGAASTGNITITQGANQNISITPHGTGAVVIDGSSWPTADGPSGYVLTTNGAGSLSWALAGTGDLVITGTTISAGTTNADITVTSSGTGNFNVDMDTLRLGDSNTDANITTNGTGDLILSTNSSTNSGSIRIYDGTGGNIEINPYVDLTLITNKVIVGESNANALLTTNGTGNLSLTANGNAATSAYAYITVDNDGDVNINATQAFEANRSVYVTLGDSRSTSSDVGKLFVNTIVNSPEIETNIIRSNDSSAIQVDDGINFNGIATFNASPLFSRYITEKINPLTYSTTITVNANTAPVHKVTLTNNTGFVITNLPTGGSLSLIIVQDGTGGRTATFGTDASTSVKFAGGSATLSTGGNSIDIVSIFNDGTNYYGVLTKAFS
jgi:hypothetical protein